MNLTSLSPSDNPSAVLRYKQKAAMLFQKLQTLQQTAEAAKSSKQKSLLSNFQQTETKVLETSKAKQDWYHKILNTVAAIQNHLVDQKHQEEKCKRSIKTWVEATERELNTVFETMEREKVKQEAALEKFVEAKLESFVLKNKGTWNQGSLVNGKPFIEEIDFLKKEHRKFLDQMEKECDKLKKQTYNALKEYIRIVEEQISRSDEEEITSFMKNVHMDITVKLGSLREQRQRTEQKVLAILEKVVTSCLVQSQVK